MSAFMDTYRITPAPPVGEDRAVDALAAAVCKTGGHMPGNRHHDHNQPDACDFHRRMAYAYVRTVDEARGGAR